MFFIFNCSKQNVKLSRLLALLKRLMLEMLKKCRTTKQDYIKCEYWFKKSLEIWGVAIK